MELTGTVVKAPFGRGTKSERQAVYLEADNGERYVLRRVGENAFDDAALEPLVGKRVTCTGRIIDYTLLADSIEPA